MPLPTVEFSFGEHVFRYTKLANMALAREHHKLLTRFDAESGALNALAFTFESEDFSSFFDDAGGVFRLVKMLSMVIGTADVPTEPTEVDIEAAALAPHPSNVLPRTLDGLYLYYAALGKVERRVKVEGQAEPLWMPCQTEKQLDEQPLELAPSLIAFHVLKGVFAPFAGPLIAFFKAAKGKAERHKGTPSTPPSSTNEENEDSEAPT